VRPSCGPTENVKPQEGLTYFPPEAFTETDHIEAHRFVEDEDLRLVGVSIPENWHFLE
jgi:hypothetical protein